MNKYDIAILENYWTRFDEFKNKLEKIVPNENPVYFSNLESIVIGLSKVYEVVDEELKQIIEMRYWNKSDALEWIEIADELFISRSKVIRKRNLLLKKTIDAIGYVA
ncbi:hypothetical protein ACIQYS_14445 [Psychrobacillus sp. NPDC096426]|uniref:hypothetical protein n=1 Tax=Psychrobacillus sp. NPDC096426 TaxID=3364491 RepID=UPI00380C2C1D